MLIIAFSYLLWLSWNSFMATVPLFCSSISPFKWCQLHRSRPKGWWSSAQYFWFGSTDYHGVFRWLVLQCILQGIAYMLTTVELQEFSITKFQFSGLNLHLICRPYWGEEIKASQFWIQQIDPIWFCLSRTRIWGFNWRYLV